MLLNHLTTSAGYALRRHDMKLLQRTLQLLTGSAQSARPLKSLTERELIEHESVVGRHLFGPIPDGHRREFLS